MQITGEKPQTDLNINIIVKRRNVHARACVKRVCFVVRIDEMMRGIQHFIKIWKDTLHNSTMRARIGANASD